MNHDYARCLDYTKDCPKECFRAELQRNIEENRSEFIGVPLTYAHLRGKEECELAKDTDVPDKKVGEWIPVGEGLPPSREDVIVSVCDETGDTRYNYTSHGWLTTDKEYWIVENEINNYVVAWMPLPKPWEGE